jgi:L-lactate dehydrogenase complex protein LldG
MSSREEILGRVRRSLGVTAGDVTRRAAVTDRLQRSPRGVVPARGQLEPEARIRLFMDKAAAVQASVERVGSPSDVPAAVADYLRGKNLPQAVRTGDDPRLAAVEWSTQPQLALSRGPSGGDDLVCLSHAEAGVAETGSLVLVSGPDNPTTLNFLPDHHVVLVRAADVAGDLESVWTSLRGRYGAGVMPRTVNLVTGPSRSADIEQTLLLGAHGPRSLHIVVVG